MRILIVDDEPRIRSSLKGLLEDEGYRVTPCASAEAGIELLEQHHYDALFLDVMLPGMTGLEALKQIQPLQSGLKVMMMSGEADLAMAIEATRLGAVDFFEKPLNPDRVILAARQVATQLKLEQRVSELERQTGAGELIGQSPGMLAVNDMIQRAAPTDGRVLILGENGTGKELVARAIHRGSPRKSAPFISLNCAAIPKDLVESELFGHEKGAFTGAVRRKSGRFELADGGTLFLDEIADMGLETQAKLLRVLQEGEATRIGGETPFPFDVRVLAATNKDLSAEIVAGRFREDLFYRLNVVPIVLPPLRDRGEDICLLARHFLMRYLAKSGKPQRQWSASALALLQGYAWPGNVRELENTVERLVILGDGPVIEAEELRRMLPVSEKNSAVTAASSGFEGDGFRQQVEAFEKGVLSRGMGRCAGNVSQLARELQMDRANLHRKLKQYGLK